MRTIGKYIYDSSLKAINIFCLSKHILTINKYWVHTMGYYGGFSNWFKGQEFVPNFAPNGCESFLSPFVDFLSARFIANTLSELLIFINSLASDINASYFQANHIPYRGKDYSMCWREADAFFLVHAMEPNKITGKVETRLELSGSYFRHFDYSQQIVLLSKLAALSGFVPTRIDCSFDDYKRRFTYEELLRIADNDLFIPAETSDYRKSRIIDGYGPGQSVTFGSRFSERRLIVYDAEYKHQIPADRWELSFKKNCAISALKYLLIGDDNGIKYNPAQLVLGTFTFFESLGGLDDYDTIHPLWLEMIQEASGQVLEVTARKIDTTFLGKLEHVCDKYSANFALFKLAFGEQLFNEFIDRLTEYGAKRMSSRHKACLAKYRLQTGGEPFNLDTFFASLEKEEQLEESQEVS